MSVCKGAGGGTRGGSGFSKDGKGDVEAFLGVDEVLDSDINIVLSISREPQGCLCHG